MVESLGLRISKSEVSRICQGLDEQVDAFRNRLLEGRYPYLWLDAKVEKVRDGGRVVRKVLVLAYGVHVLAQTGLLLLVELRQVCAEEPLFGVSLFLDRETFPITITRAPERPLP